MTTTLTPFDLDRFLEQISHQLGVAGGVRVHRPAEATQLEALPRAELDTAAARHAMTVVRRMGGKQFEFTRRHPIDFPYKALAYPR